MQKSFILCFTKLIIGTILSAFLAFSTLNAQPLKEGRDYIVLKNPLNVPQKSIVEIFNVGCPHCAKMAKILPKLFAVIPQEAVFLPYHIITGSQFSAQASEVLAVAVSIDEERTLHSRDIESYFRRASNAYFDAFSKQKIFKNKDSFIDYGLDAMEISRTKFETQLHQTDVQEKLKIWQDSIEQTGIKSLPSFIINGKYLILTQNVKDTEDFIYKIDYLLGK
ncbi:thiol:disulfide interchange protein DsbA/DsbL [Helicobacter sp. MIT 11-5569]|uniref:thioredoxin domain-containing protein n=1 Tax=Helicobacter sp. MIT 11-5569 TaxID=1548151 RepID=UPI000689AEB5|nr:thioredoxin domain-containing protein [Helicobacter sp. MIT 11-5569]TLD85163.1 thiol:disulfide interchange protein DsbA/DsbL [Helicobacter sp. MIT 11-5569]